MSISTIAAWTAVTASMWSMPSFGYQPTWYDLWPQISRARKRNHCRGR